jgi:hypothetical protein
MSEGRYVYAILGSDTPLPVDVTGLRGSRVETVCHRALCAATSAIDATELRVTAHDALEHEAVVEGLRQFGPAIPVRFGTVLAGTPAVVRALSERYDTLVADLARLAGTVEFGLSVLWEEPDWDAGTEPPITTLGGIASDEPGKPGSRYLRARLLQHRRDAARRAKAEAAARALDTLFHPLVLDTRWTIRPSSRVAARAAYLLHLSAVEAFQQAFEEARVLHPDLRFLLSGPWPPYNFVTTPESGAAAVADTEGRPAYTANRRG